MKLVNIFILSDYLLLLLFYYFIIIIIILLLLLLRLPGTRNCTRTGMNVQHYWTCLLIYRACRTWLDWEYVFAVVCGCTRWHEKWTFFGSLGVMGARVIYPFLYFTAPHYRQSLKPTPPLRVWLLCLSVRLRMY